MKKLIFLLAVLTLPHSSAIAGDFQWSGLYRIEGYSISNSELNDTKREKSYGLHHLVLRPRIEAADGLTVRARFDIFNNSTYANDPIGEVWGSGVNPSGAAATTTDAQDSNVLSNTQSAETLMITEMYLTLVQEFGALVVGRAPLHFGLGMVHNAGKGPFDHWQDTRDLIGYKIVMGNLFLLPMYGKVNEGDLQKPDDVTDWMVQFQYENPDTGLEMGLFYQSRSASQGNDQPSDGGAPPVFPVGGTGAEASERDSKSYSVYGLKETKTSRFGVEASWQEGNYGVRQSDGNEVSTSGLGLALEFEYRPETSKYKFGINAGYATGDDPETDDKMEGFIFDRNYDVAFLMFNHTLGRKNLLRTETIGVSNYDADGNFEHNTPDIEAISNVYYLSPYIKYKWNDRWELETSLTTAFLTNEPLVGEEVEKALGYELDISFNFRPNDRVTWINGIGMLFPGSAFKAGDTNDFETSFAYGLISKAAISF